MSAATPSRTVGARDLTPAAAPLDRFFSPRSIAIVGASPDSTKIRGVLLALLRRNGYAGRILPVNPSYSEIDGLPCFPTIEAVKEPIDLALIAIPAAQVLAALEACAAAGVRHCVIISSGFAEEGGTHTALQQRICELARRTRMRICGPNGEGFYNEIDSVSATFSPAVDRPQGAEPITAATRRIAIVAQSGGVGFSLYQRGRALGLAFSYVVSTGNEVDLSVADFLDYVVENGRTAAVLLFLETVRDADRFLAAARRAAQAAIPVIVIKVGRTRAGERAALSHTASMAGWDAAYEAAFRSCGIIVASDPDEAITIAAALTTSPPAQGKRACVVTVSGGAGAWAADTLAAAGLDLPELPAPLQQAIRELIPSYGSALNPVDITAQAVHGGTFIAVIELLSRCEEIDLLLIVSSMARETRVPLDAGALRRIREQSGKPMLFYSYTLPSVPARKSLAEAGAVIFTALAAVGRAARELTCTRGGAPSPPVAGLVAPAAVREKLDTAGKTTLTEHESKAALSAWGIDMPFSLLVHSPDELDSLPPLRYPVAAKIQSRDITHKTEVGGVRLNIGDGAALRAAYAAVIATSAARAPTARIAGVLVEPMAAPGVEMIVGVVRDAVFGPVLMVGAGGTATELFRDVAYRLAPVSLDEAHAMLAELRISRLLHGFRGAPPSDTAALVELIVNVSSLAAACRDVVREIELNPVIVHAQGAGCSVADALIVLEPDAPSGA